MSTPAEELLALQAELDLNLDIALRKAIRLLPGHPVDPSIRIPLAFYWKSPVPARGVYVVRVRARRNRHKDPGEWGGELVLKYHSYANGQKPHVKDKEIGKYELPADKIRAFDDLAQAILDVATKHHRELPRLHSTPTRRDVP